MAIVAAALTCAIVLGAGALIVTRGKSRAAADPQPEWTASVGQREDVKALAYAFPSLDERDLGTVFDAQLKPIYGAEPLFDNRVPRHVRRDEMSHALLSLTDTIQFEAGFRYLLTSVGAKWNAAREYRLYRAIQLAEVIRIDDTKPLRRPPDNAVFYLAEVRKGASYDMMIEGEREEMGARLDTALAAGTASASTLRTKSKYIVRQRGAGLRPKAADAIFATTPELVSARYETTEHPVPIELVFRTIPGRVAPKKALPRPTVVADKRVSLPEGRGEQFSFPRPGTYYIRAASEPSGIVMSWSGDARCDPPTEGPERKNIATQCQVRKGAILTVRNYTRTYLGSTEDATVRIVRLPATP